MDLFYIIPALLSWLFWPALIIGIIIFIQRRNKKKSVISQKDWFMELSLSKEDFVSQMFFLLGLMFFGITLLAFNQDFGQPISWRLILFITVVTGFSIAYYFKKVYSLLASVIGLMTWWISQSLFWLMELNKAPEKIASAGIFSGCIILTLIYFALGHIHDKENRFRRFAWVYILLSIFFVTGSLFFFSTKIGVFALGEMTKGASIVGVWQILIFLGIFFITFLGVSFYAFTQKNISSYEFTAVIGLGLLFAVIALLPEQAMVVGNFSWYDSNDILSGTGILWAVVFNIVLFFELVGLIFSGYIRHEAWRINMGAVLLFLLIIVKYFDWFFTFMDKSIFFIGAGILLLVAGWYMEKGRRYMISNMKAQMQEIQ